MEHLLDEHRQQLDMAKAGAKALSALSESRPNKEVMRKYGLVPLMSRLLKSIHIELVVPIMGTCQQCASEVDFVYDIFKSKNLLFNISVHGFDHFSRVFNWQLPQKE